MLDDSQEGFSLTFNLNEFFRVVVESFFRLSVKFWSKNVNWGKLPEPDGFDVFDQSSHFCAKS